LSSPEKRKRKRKRKKPTKEEEEEREIITGPWLLLQRTVTWEALGTGMVFIVNLSEHECPLIVGNSNFTCAFGRWISLEIVSSR
jgi:hypothetical protein